MIKKMQKCTISTAPKGDPKTATWTEAWKGIKDSVDPNKCVVISKVCTISKEEHAIEILK